MKKGLKYVYDMQKEISLFSQTGALLDWDHQVYMPKLGSLSRAEQTSLISKEIHKRLISNKLFNEAKNLLKTNLKGRDGIVVNRLYNDLLIARKLPLDFVGELSKTTSLAHNIWEESREKNNFNLFKPILKKIVDLKKKECNYLDFKGHAYNGLFNYYEEGMTVEKIVPLFNKLKYELIELLQEIKKSKHYNKKFKFLNRNYPRESEKKIALELKELLGLKNDNSRMDLSAHPFTTSIGIGDTRVTYRFVDENVLSSFFSVAHETGHAFYELDLPEKYKYTVVHDAASFGLHESQSRFWENMICRSKSFWRYFYPKYKREFKINAGLDEWYRAVNKVGPGFIRLEADEVSYALHIILRLELEMGLIDGSIRVDDLPKKWNKKMKEYLNVNVGNDSDGVLQDVHWSGGGFGYFPTYAIGSIYAAQLYDKMNNKKFLNDIESGRFGGILNWLNKNIHRHGREKNAEDIIKNVCGCGLNPEVYVKYLRRKYLDIYK